jgi:hypothetical protein
MRFYSVFALLFSTCCFGQSVNTDTTFLRDAKHAAIELYNREMSSQSHLINGVQYNRVQKLHSDASRLEQAHPYLAFEWTSGTVLYDNEWYSATFLYDLSQDNLIMSNPALQKQLLLVREKVEQFTLGNSRFVKLSTDQKPEEFYEITYDGETKVYIRKKKKLERVVGQNVDVPYRYISTTDYFIKKGDTYYPVNSKRSVLKVLFEHEVELKRFLHSQSLSFKENRALLISKMAQVYDQSPAEK